MKLTAKARSAVTAMADLASHGTNGPVSLRDIATRQLLSVAFLEQIFGKLRKAGLVESQRGAAGGYRLNHPADAITVSAIVRAMDEEIRATACHPGQTKGCHGTSSKCLTHNLWRDMDRMIEGYLEGVTLADLAGQEAEEGENA